MPLTGILASSAGWLRAPVITYTSRRPTLPGSTKWKSGLTSSRRKPSAGEPSAASKNLSPRPNASSIATTLRPDPSPGRQHPIRSWKKSSDYVTVFLGQHTSFVSYLASEEAGFITVTSLTIDGGYAP